MLPESKFPVTGGIMQSEEIVSRAHQSLLDAPGSECRISASDQQPADTTAAVLQHQQTQSQSQSQREPYPQQQQPPSMAVKQEPVTAEEEQEQERNRQTSSLSPQMEIDEGQGLARTEGNVVDDRRASVQQRQQQNVKTKFEPPARAPRASPNALSPSSTSNCGKKQPSRGRRKSRWKLKFHHQALPPEYLDHYEAALAQEVAAAGGLSSAPANSHHELQAPIPGGNPPNSRQVLPSSFASGPTPPVSDVQSWLQRFALMQRPDLCPSPSSAAARRSVITSTHSSSSSSTSSSAPAIATSFPGCPPASSQQQNQYHHQNHQPIEQQHQQQSSSRPPMQYSDLPYMGEITLDNSKPRRGRKPKKADICHLIYKNYGTILPGTPGLHQDDSRLGGQSVPIAASQQQQHRLADSSQQLPPAFQRSDIQNRISSLLERRLTQERRALDEARDAAIAASDASTPPPPPHREQDGPLNLCVRDFKSDPRSESGSSDAEDAECLYNNHLSVPENDDDENNNNNNNNNGSTEDRVENSNGNGNGNNNNGCGNGELANHSNGDSSPRHPNAPSTPPAPNNLVYWPNANVLMHPASLQSQFLYYQKLAQERASEQQQPQSQHQQRIVPKSIYSMLENAKPPAAPGPSLSPTESATPIPAPAVSETPSPRPRRSPASTAQSQQQSTAKRKRSAIFIPPVPAENTTNPATEVSICKFKFTGGVRPTLQEKKSLSVDSGGNFRYYSGTGDKSMRGYEFFPRETLQQQQQQQHQQHQQPLPAQTRPSPAPLPPSPQSVLQEDARARKRKTRKSIQREKLEQTFKEKGFLIQTQQLESAEGATYCKFRQLRKFTRYLFRSWKDYLPGNVRELNPGQQQQQPPQLMPIAGSPEGLPPHVKVDPQMGEQQLLAEQPADVHQTAVVDT